MVNRGKTDFKCWAAIPESDFSISNPTETQKVDKRAKALLQDFNKAILSPLVILLFQ